jgi:hypothetical protein
MLISKDCLNYEDGMDKLSRTVGNQLPIHTPLNIPEEGIPRTLFIGILTVGF